MIPDLGEHVPIVAVGPDDTDPEQLHTDSALVDDVKEESAPPTVDEVEKGEGGVHPETLIPKLQLSTDKDDSDVDDDDSDGGIDLGFLNDASVQQSIRSVRSGTV